MTDTHRKSRKLGKGSGNWRILVPFLFLLHFAICISFLYIFLCYIFLYYPCALLGWRYVPGSSHLDWVIRIMMALATIGFFGGLALVSQRNGIEWYGRSMAAGDFGNFFPRNE
jgi:hypothetical protein